MPPAAAVPANNIGGNCQNGAREPDTGGCVARVCASRPAGATAAFAGFFFAEGGPKLFTPWMALQDQELARED